MLSLVKEYKGRGLLEENIDNFTDDSLRKLEEQPDWNPWIEKQEKRVADKKWYEKNIMNIK